MPERTMPTGGTWYVACSFSGWNMIGVEDYEDAVSIADVHRDRHPEHPVRVLWAPEPF